jgi:hypothetical protein
VLTTIEHHYLFGSQLATFDYDIHQVLVVLTLEWDSKILVENKSTVDVAQELTHGRNERQTRKVRKHTVWVL